MALELFMLGLITQDMGKSLEFYRRLGLTLPEGSEEQPHVEVKMQSGLTFFLNIAGLAEIVESPHVVLECNLKERRAVDTKYAELTGFGYQSYHAPFFSPSAGAYLAMVHDPDGNIVVLSAA